MPDREEYLAIPARYPELSGKVALVTGSTRDIGRGIAERLTREGMKVVINSRTPEAVEETTDDLRSNGADVLPIVADVSEDEGIKRLIGDTMDHYGTIDLLVNNAADLRRRTLLDGTEELLDIQLATNVRGPYLLCLRSAEIMREKGAGSLINISTVGAIRAHHSGLPYDATKGALDAMTRAMAADLGREGIRVNGIAPGPIRDKREFTGDPEKVKSLRARLPLGMCGLPHDIGAAVAFLASEDAFFITGQIIYVDGGLTAQLTPRDAPI
jgi:3-oxoacyl-[acyl-carrier protein] reductase